ncbi:uncharacterized radical SAM protein YgiQ [Desulfocicer vacuolatum DSM 3385]|uniref:Uncharacterized radical SAM protein YgiQ n=1 Tax=Desulfocicer vacuolatum DSM 3385 TaxID=1121400 RepID=A0A1W1YPC0_9BACT|nr:YgiQ family radical SAM protein [Desulfocicer vacuolatum]SMC37976.1 uncharacterized radical SAM protein YgiQ [Desulfocicer vacuolatum DSM 3385]
MFLPTTKKECRERGWRQLDVIIVTGDSYIDSAFIGAAVIGKTLTKMGFKVGIIAQPDMDSPGDITRLGEPKLFWGITAGAVDSMVSNYTATKKRRKKDDYTPGGINNRRPDRAVIAYTNLIKHYFKGTCPIVLGGMEASLRRVAHYDFWSNKIRRSILFDAKADYLIYGMGENSVMALAKALHRHDKAPCPDTLQRDISKIKGLCHISRTPVPGYKELPSFDRVKKDPKAFIQSFHDFYQNNDALTATGIIQKQDARYLVQNPPWPVPDTAEMDRIHDLDFERELHPYYEKMGHVKALDTIRFSVSTHRGCYGECNFCAIALHEGRTVRWRSQDAIVKEVEKMTAHPKFKGNISDVGGPTANMYGFECKKKRTKGPCRDKRCLFPATCNSLMPDHANQISLLKRIKAVKGVKKVFVASGIRYDLILADKKHGQQYLGQIVKDHVSGQMKIAPEHTEKGVLELMGKPGETKALVAFKNRFDTLSKKADKKQFLTYYFMAAHPGCQKKDMGALRQFVQKELGIHPEQVQIFTPTPSTYATLMYVTGFNPFSMEKIFVEKNVPEKEKQKQMITGFGKTAPKRHGKAAGSKPCHKKINNRCAPHCHGKRRDRASSPGNKRS